jgi:hypothetical protein
MRVEFRPWCKDEVALAYLIFMVSDSRRFALTMNLKSDYKFSLSSCKRFVATDRQP